jgi:hypothetical protein
MIPDASSGERENNDAEEDDVNINTNTGRLLLLHLK